MFGIGKKNETDNSAVKEGQKGREDEIQFDFEEDDKLPFDDDDGYVDEGFTEEDVEEESPRKGLPQRSLLLILLLLLALGGGAYYYLNGPLDQAPQSEPVKAKVAVEPATPKPDVKPETPVAASPVPDQGLQAATPTVPEKVASAPAETVATAPAPTP
ncbi:MAG: hypothetical protein U1D97_15475, partial [Desulfuromonadales bacterium]|nr:hypothetical protein [Desulfuromonadales bacterium]